jgi:nucleotide-binding universal stress UspA family protein
MKHITVAIDGSPAAEAAVRYSCELARAGAALSFCSISANAQASSGSAVLQPDAATESMRATEMCEAAVVHARALGIKADRHESSLHLAEAVVGCARTQLSEVIVTGNDARPGFLHLRADIGEHLMRIDGDIAVTISGYDASNVVLDTAIAFALFQNRSLVLIEEITPPEGVDYAIPWDELRARLDDAMERALSAGVKSQLAAGDGIGSISQGLIELAGQHNCAMIVTGLHDRSALSRFFAGSVAHQLVLEAKVPVVVIHHPFQPQPD